MTRILILGYFIGIIISAVLIWGLTFGYFQNRFPNLAQEDRGSDAALATGESMFSIFWPVTLPLAYMTSNFNEYGMRWDFGAGSNPSEDTYIDSDDQGTCLGIIHNGHLISCTK